MTYCFKWLAVIAFMVNLAAPWFASAHYTIIPQSNETSFKDELVIHSFLHHQEFINDVDFMDLEEDSEEEFDGYDDESILISERVVHGFVFRKQFVAYNEQSFFHSDKIYLKNRNFRI